MEWINVGYTWIFNAMERNEIMTAIRFLIITFIFNIYVGNAYSFNGPDTFSDLAEKVSPSVVNISTTGTIEQTGAQVPVSYTHLTLPTKA